MEKTKVLSQTIFLQTHLALSIFGKVAGAVSAGVKLLAVEALRFLVFKVDMKHAYLILAHHEPEVLRLLLTLLDDARNDIYLHIDGRAQRLYEQFEHWQPQSARFFLLSQRVKPEWGQVSIVRAELLLFSAALQQKSPYAYYHLLSGVDLTLKSKDEIHAFFAKHQGKEFLHCGFDEASMCVALKRVSRHYLFLRALCKRKKAISEVFKKILSKSVLGVEKIARYRRYSLKQKFYYGSQWGSFTHDFCEYLVKHSDEVLDTFSHTFCPDELYKQTVIMSSPFAERLYAKNAVSNECTQRFIDWSREKDGHPHIFDSEDYDLLVNSPYMFARKFSSHHPQLLKLWYDRLSKKK